MNIDAYCERQKCRPMILDSENIRFMGIFAGVPLSGSVNYSRVVDDGNFWRSSETSEIRPAILHGDMLPLDCL